MLHLVSVAEDILREVPVQVYTWVEVKGQATLYSYTVVCEGRKAIVLGLARFKGVEGGVLAPVVRSG